MNKNLKQLEQMIQYEFHDKKLFRQAMIHTSSWTTAAARG